MNALYIQDHANDAVSGWAGSEFGSSVNPIPTKGVRLFPPHTDCPPGFENLTTSLHAVHIS